MKVQEKDERKHPSLHCYMAQPACPKELRTEKGPANHREGPREIKLRETLGPSKKSKEGRETTRPLTVDNPNFVWYVR